MWVYKRTEKNQKLKNQPVNSSEISQSSVRNQKSPKVFQHKEFNKKKVLTRYRVLN